MQITFSDAICVQLCLLICSYLVVTIHSFLVHGGLEMISHIFRSPSNAFNGDIYDKCTKAWTEFPEKILLLLDDLFVTPTGVESTCELHGKMRYSLAISCVDKQPIRTVGIVDREIQARLEFH